VESIRYYKRVFDNKAIFWLYQKAGYCPIQRGVNLMSKTVAIWIIALCCLANTVGIYGPDEYGSGSIFFGNFGYAFDNEVTE